MGTGNFQGKGRPIVKSCGTMDELIEMPYGTPRSVSPRNHALDGGAGVPMGRGNFRGVSGLLQSIEF